MLEESVQQEWLSYPEAERYSGLSHTTLWRYVTSGELKAARIGRSVRIHLPTLRDFMEAASERQSESRQSAAATRRPDVSNTRR
jgi:excisionase family DNA binding protein